MHIKQSVINWGLIFIVFALAIYLVSDILFPFVFAGVIAYFLHPIADKVEASGFSRSVSTIIAIAGFGVILAAIIFFIGPVFIDQFKKFSVKFPQIFSELEFRKGSYGHKLITKYAPDLDGKIQDFAYKFAVQIIQFIAISVQSIVTSSKAIFNFISIVIISPIVSFYLLRDWDLMVKKIDDLLPRTNLGIIRGELRKIDDTVSAYIRGQVTVCIIMAVVYSTTLSLIGLDYALAIGVMTGILTFIPYVGMSLGFILALMVSYFQFQDFDMTISVIAAFILGNLLEGYIITPKFVGEKVNLHPVWIIFALLAGGSIMGFTGVLIAIPSAAIIGVLVRSSISRYRKSSLYLGYPIMALEKPRINRGAERGGSYSERQSHSNDYDSSYDSSNNINNRNPDVFKFENDRFRDSSSSDNSKPRRGRPPKKI
ncbi:MAG: AI-2E family transporter [Rickettsiales bacterium]|nr:AI-2E family transporter [Rickettsiales bacterium]